LALQVRKPEIFKVLWRKGVDPRPILGFQVQILGFPEEIGARESDVEITLATNIERLPGFVTSSRYRASLE
jgi:hypothetical protein